MEQEKSKELRQTTLQLRCEKIPHTGKTGNEPCADVQRRKVDERDEHACGLTSPTPEKIVLPPRSRKGKECGQVFRNEAENSKMLSDTADNKKLTVETHESWQCRDASGATYLQQNSQFSVQSLEDKMGQLTEKYKIIAGLFDKVVTSLRLLGLRRMLGCFQSVSAQVEILAKRKLTLNHLAQMKYLFPEAVHIEKILIHDKISLCMKPDVKISLILDAAKDLHDTQHSLYVNLCQSFRARLVDFLNTHPEGIEIPEAPLPEPFDERNPAVPCNQSPARPSVEQVQLVPVDDTPLSVASHLCPSFSGHFSQRIFDPAKQKAKPCVSSTSIISMDAIGESTEDLEEKQIHLNDVCSHSLQKDESTSVGVFSPGHHTFSLVHARTLDESHTDVISSPRQHTFSHLDERTPMKFMSTPDKLVTETPVLPTPKRPVASPDVKLMSEMVVLNHSARRSLIYSPSKSDKNGFDLVPDNSGVSCYNTCCSPGRDTKRSLSEVETSRYHASDLQMAQENEIDYDGTHVGLSKRQQILASLPDLCNTINFIFGSLNSTSITKQELVHKILSCNCDIEDTAAVEEQLHLLEELVPDWICGKMISSGDFLYSISRAFDLKSVRARLIEAV